jgi:hypothetical protein
MSEKTPAQVKIEELEAKRAALRVKAKADRETREAIDLESIITLEETHGPDRVAVLDMPFTSPDLAVKVAFRAPEGPEWERYKSRIKGRGTPGEKGYQRGDSAQAAEELAGACLVYPSDADYARLCAIYQGLPVQGGTAAAALALADEDAQGKG